MGNFKKLQKVVCVDAVPRHANRPLGALTKDQVYTIKECDGIHTKIFELDPPKTIYFYTDRFREISDEETLENRRVEEKQLNQEKELDLIEQD